MADDIFGGLTGIFGGIGQFKNVLVIIGFVLIYLMVAGIILWIIISIHKKASALKLFEFNQSTRQIRILESSMKKMKSGYNQIYIPKYKKHIPSVAEEYKFLQGAKGVACLMKDKVGLLHNLKLPEYEDIVKWYKSVHNLDISKSFESLLPAEKEAFEKANTVFFLPNPSEDLNWLADKCVEADKTYMASFWKSPVFIWGMTLAACLITFLMTLIISKRM